MSFKSFVTLLINFSRPSLRSVLTESGYQSEFLFDQFRFDLDGQKVNQSSKTVFSVSDIGRFDNLDISDFVARKDI